MANYIQYGARDVVTQLWHGPLTTEHASLKHVAILQDGEEDGRLVKVGRPRPPPP